MLVLIFKVILVVELLILIIGMIKPKWVLFWMKHPDRLTLSSIVLIMFMISMTGYSKLTLKPKPKDPGMEHVKEKQSRDQANEINLSR